MESARGFAGAKARHLNYDAVLVLKLPDPEAIRVVSRSVFLALVILALPYVGYIFTEPSSSSYLSGYELHNGSDLISFEFMDLVFDDLANEGLLRKGHKGLIVSSGFEGYVDSARFSIGKDVDLEPVREERYDFVFVWGSMSAKLVDSIVKIGGIVVVQLSDEHSNALQELSNYKIVYIRRFGFTVLALKKIGKTEEPIRYSSRLICKAKREVLKGLEDVLLEPPRGLEVNSNELLKKIRYLPDLLGDSLEDYPSRVFINVGFPKDKRRIMEWFQQNYPTRNKDFDVYYLETMSEEGSSLVSGIGISDWLRKNVRGDDYVVMKAEAEIVEDMIAKRTVYLVDELFLECKNQWQDGGKRSKSKRAYWECLALYGRLMDEGVAVHQWWD